MTNTQPQTDLPILAGMVAELAKEAQDWRHNGYTRVYLAQLHDRLAALSTTHPSTAGDAPEVPAEREAAIWERARAEIINTPETADFMAGVPIEAAHQRERWGVNHDAGKAPEDWFWLIGYLAQKALRAQNSGDTDKALHHTISAAAALANWHAAIAGVDTSMRPGIAPPTAIREASHG